jgi:hypothetical protein
MYNTSQPFTTIRTYHNKIAAPPEAKVHSLGIKTLHGKGKEELDNKHDFR